MPIESYAKDGTLVIAILDERLTEETQLRRIYDDLVGLLGKSSEEQVVLDFSKVQFMSSSMLGKLVQFHKKCQEYKTKLKLAAMTPDIQQVFKITKLHKLFDFHPDVETARKAFSKRGLFG